MPMENNVSNNIIEEGSDQNMSFKNMKSISNNKKEKISLNTLKEKNEFSKQFQLQNFLNDVPIEANAGPLTGSNHSIGVSSQEHSNGVQNKFQNQKTQNPKSAGQRKGSNTKQLKQGAMGQEILTGNRKTNMIGSQHQVPVLTIDEFGIQNKHLIN